jgi:hypothetical protein
VDGGFMVALYVLLIGAGLVQHQRDWIRARGEAWIDALRRHGFRTSNQFRWFDWTIEARSGEMTVTALRVPGEGRTTNTLLRLRPREWHAGDLACWSSGGAGAATELPPTRVRTGDEEFDSKVFLSGPPDRILATFDRLGRESILRLAKQCEVTIGGSELRLKVEEGRLSSSQANVLGTAIGLVTRLASPLDPPAELERNAREDPLPGVREQSLLALARSYADDPRSEATLLAATNDPSPRVRLTAGRELRERGVPTLLSLLGDESLGDTLRAETVTTLGRRFPEEMVEPLLKQALRTRRIAMATAIAELAGRFRFEGAAATLARIVRIESGALAVAAARALGASRAGDSFDAEPALIEALGRDEPGLALAVIGALERVGTAAAVLPLKRCADGDRGEPEVRRAVGRAVAAIRARTPGASPGQLSLAAAPSGQLSLVPDAAGKLSFAGDEAGRLSEPRAPA